jgi:hypothetical protein
MSPGFDARARSCLGVPVEKFGVDIDNTHGHAFCSNAEPVQ